MSSVLPVVVCLVAMLIQALLQLTPASFACFYHCALGHTTAKQADNASLFYILGVEIFTASLWLIVYYIFFALFSNFPDTDYGLLPWLLAGICFALAIVSFFCYFRPGKGTALFISRHLADNIRDKISQANSNSDAFTLGFLASIPELIFTLPLYAISAIVILNLTAPYRVWLIIGYVILNVIPLFIIRFKFRTGQNLATIQRTRVKHKLVVRTAITIGYALLTAIILYSEVLN